MQLQVFCVLFQLPLYIMATNLCHFCTCTNDRLDCRTAGTKPGVSIMINQNTHFIGKKYVFLNGLDGIVFTRELCITLIGTVELYLSRKQCKQRNMILEEIVCKKLFEVIYSRQYSILFF